jgi:hypothetical protein
MVQNVVLNDVLHHLIEMSTIKRKYLAQKLIAACLRFTSVTPNLRAFITADLAAQKDPAELLIAVFIDDNLRQYCIVSHHIRTGQQYAHC